MGTLEELIGMTTGDDTVEANVTFVVEDSTELNNSVVHLSPVTMDDLNIWYGVAILLEGNNNRKAVCTVLTDENCGENKIRMNEVVRNKFGVSLGDSVTMGSFLEIPRGRKIVVRPIRDGSDFVQENLFESYLRPYFFGANRPVNNGDVFSVKGRTRTIQFKVIKTLPSPFCVVGPSTIIYCEEQKVANKRTKKGPVEVSKKPKGPEICLQSSVTPPVLDGDAFPIQNADPVPSPTVDKLPVPAVNKLQAPIVEKLPAPTVHRLPAPTADNLPAPTADNLPAPTVDKLPAPTVNKLPAPTVNKLKAPTVHKLPSSTADNLPAPTVDKLPAPTLHRLPAPTADKLPAPTVNELPAPTINKLPAPTVNKLPSPTVEKLIAPAVNKFPAPTVNKLLAPTVEKLRAPAVNKFPAPTVDKLPAPTVIKLPAPTVDKLPAPTVDKAPAPTVDKLPSPALNKTIEPTNLEDKIALAHSLHRQGRLKGAGKAFQEIKQAHAKTLGRRHPEMLPIRVALATIMYDSRQFVLLTNVFLEDQQLQNYWDPAFLDIKLVIAMVLTEQKKFEDATRILYGALERRKSMNLHFVKRLKVKVLLATALYSQNKWEEALKVLSHENLEGFPDTVAKFNYVLKILTKRKPLKSPCKARTKRDLLITKCHIAWFYGQLKDNIKATQTLQEILPFMKKRMGSDHFYSQFAETHLQDCKKQLGQERERQLY